MKGTVVDVVRRSGRVVKGLSMRCCCCDWELFPPRELRKFWTRAEVSCGWEVDDDALLENGISLPCIWQESMLSMETQSFDF